jgi:hypothetical protein
VVGCVADDPDDRRSATSSADCAAQVRRDGAVYTGYGRTARALDRLGTADLAVCEDVGGDPRGSVFPDPAEQVTVWSVRGYPTDAVLGVRRRPGLVEVFVADRLPRGTRDRLLRDLTTIR